MRESGEVSGLDIPAEVNALLNASEGNHTINTADANDSLAIQHDSSLSHAFENEKLAKLERMIIEKRIELNGSIPKAAASLDVSPSTIYRKQENWVNE